MPDSTSDAPSLYPTLRCRDAEAMIRWLERALGFTQRVVYRGDGVVQHAELALGSSILMLGQARDDAYGGLVGPSEGRRTDSIYVAVDDADAAHDAVVRAAGHIETPPRDTPYGSREFLCRDPEGNLWSVGTYRPRVGEAPLPG